VFLEDQGWRSVRISVRVRGRDEVGTLRARVGLTSPEILQGPAARNGEARVQLKDLGGDLQAFCRLEVRDDYTGADSGLSAAAPSTLAIAPGRTSVSAAPAAVVAGLRPTDETIAADRGTGRRRPG